VSVEEKYTSIGGGDQTPTMLVIHSMGEYIEFSKAAKDWCVKNDHKNKDLTVGTYHAHEWLQHDGTSAHFLLKPDGDFIKQRSTKKICWHAKGFNTNSVGIEVLVPGTYNYETFLEAIKKDWVSDIQYKSLIDMSQGIIDYFKIKKDRIVRHSDISPGRKFDPGVGFKWEYFLDSLKF
jgi:N-acetyl-anhydromuramyl-L-alanine amidase AmpD